MIKKLLILMIAIFISLGFYIHSDKKSKGDPISTKKQIEYILTIDQVKNNRDTAFNTILNLSKNVLLRTFNNAEKDTQDRLYHIWDKIFFHMLEYKYTRVKISQLVELKQEISKNYYNHPIPYENYIPAGYPRVLTESCYLKNK